MSTNGWNKCLTPDVAARFQTVQDLLAHQFNVSISILDSNGNPCTIPSNQPLCCFHSQCKLDECDCNSTYLRGIKEADGYFKPINVNCPNGLTITIVPLGENPGVPLAFLVIGKILISDNEQFNKFKRVIKNVSNIFELLFIIMVRGNLIEHIPPTSKQYLNEKYYKLLTRREQEVLTMIGTGLSNQAIAKQLFISDSTVKTHITNILKKLHMNNRTELALYKLQVSQIEK